MFNKSGCKRGSHIIKLKKIINKANEIGEKKLRKTLNEIASHSYKSSSISNPRSKHSQLECHKTCPRHENFREKAFRNCRNFIFSGPEIKRYEFETILYLDPTPAQTEIIWILLLRSASKNKATSTQLQSHEQKRYSLDEKCSKK